MYEYTNSRMDEFKNIACRGERLMYKIEVESKLLEDGHLDCPERKV